MNLQRAFFDAVYRLGRPVWDTPPPSELCDAIEGAGPLTPGHALDVGCGTGANVIYLAQHSWQATGVDFSAAAVRKAQQTAAGITGAAFIKGDVTRLSQLDISRPIDLVLDMGCYHSLPAAAKPVYVAQLASIIESGTPLMMWQGMHLKPGEITQIFLLRLRYRADGAERLHHRTLETASHRPCPLVLAASPMISTTSSLFRARPQVRKRVSAPWLHRF